MISGRTPAWLAKLERAFSWLAIPQLAVILVTLQVLGFLLVSSNPAWYNQLVLIPEAVMAGEFWRVFTFLAVPLASSPLWLFFALWFLYFIVNTLENEWGPVRTTLYVLISLLVTIAYSLILDHYVLDARHFESTLFLAAAALYPDFEVTLFFVMPIKLKFLAMVTLGFILWEMIGRDLKSWGYLLAIYSNFLLFFGPAAIDRFRQYLRRKKYLRSIR